MNLTRRRRLLAPPVVAAAPSGFLPTDLSGLVLWAKADSLGLSDGTLVSTWTDLSGAGNNFTQSGSVRPTYKTNIQNGLAVVRFTVAAVARMVTTGFTLSQPCTIALTAVQPGAAFGAYTDIITSDGGRMLIANSGTVLAMQAPTNVNTTVTTQTVFNSILAVFNGASSLLNFNGTETTTSPGTGSGAGVTIGCTGGLHNFPTQMDMGEFIAYNRALNATERGQVQTYLKGRWATP